MAATSDAKSDSFPQTGSFWTVWLIEPVQKADSSSSPSLQNKDPEGRDGSTSRGWRWVGLGIRGWWQVGLCECKVGGFGSRSNLTPWILCSAVRIISIHHQLLTLSSNDVTIKMYTMYFYYKDVIHLIVKVLSDHPYFECYRSADLVSSVKGNIFDMFPCCCSAMTWTQCCLGVWQKDSDWVARTSYFYLVKNHSYFLQAVHLTVLKLIW